MKSHIYLIILMLLVSFDLSGQFSGPFVTELKRFSIEEAKQGVAVDRKNFYVINNNRIIKLRKSDGKPVIEWDGDSLGVTHLNSGVVIKGKLYCASSNYPESPMAGSVEVFDTRTLKHMGNHSFGIFQGSVVWIDWQNGSWYAGFAHYTVNGSSEGKDTRWTSVVKFDRKWRQVEGWVFPSDILELLAPMSNSGASWGNDGKLYCTGHDAQELYVMELPETGHTLRHTGTIKVPLHGQGLASDRTIRNRNIFYGIIRNENKVTVFEVKENPSTLK